MVEMGIVILSLLLMTRGKKILLTTIINQFLQVQILVSGGCGITIPQEFK